MAFDPDKYLNDSKEERAPEKPSFDPDRYLAGGEGGSPKDVSKLESLARGAAQGASFGFAPAISGAAQAASGTLSGKDLVDTYRKARDESKKEFDAAKDANPKTYMAGGLAGAIAPSIITGGLGEGALGLSALKQGALAGAAGGLGESVSNGEDLGQTAKNVAVGGVGGGLLGGLVGKATTALGNAPESLEKFANLRGLKATGIDKGALKRMLAQDVKTNVRNIAQTTPNDAELESTVQKMGKALLEKNPYQEQPIVTPLSNTEDVLSRSQDLMAKSGKDIGDSLAKFDTQYNEPGITDQFVNPRSIEKDIKDQLLSKTLRNPNDENSAYPLVQGENTVVRNIIDAIPKGDQTIPFSDAQRLLKLVDGKINWKSLPQNETTENSLLKQAYGIIKSHIEDAAENVGNSKDELNDTFNTYKTAKQLYGTANVASQAAVGKEAGNIVNRDLGLTDYISGVGGLAAGGPLGGVAAAVGNKMAKVYGNPLMATGAKSLAKGAQKVSDVISNTSKALTSAPKEQLTKIGQDLISSGGQLQSKLGNILVNASDRDEIGKNALIFSLMQNSGYRELLKNMFGGQEQESK